MFNITKPSKISGLKKTPRFRPFYSVVFSVVLVLGLFNGFLVKNAFASNNYIDNIQFYKDSNGYYRMKFHVKTSWDVSVGPLNDNGDYYCSISPAYIGATLNPFYNFDIPFMIFPGKDNTPYIDPSVCGSTIHYVAGNTYDTFMFVGGNSLIPFTHNGLMCNKTGNCSTIDLSYEYNNGPATSNSYITNIGNYDYFPSVDTEKYYFTEYPNLAISFPHDNDELIGAFHIQGTFTQPAGNNADHLQVDYEPAGTFSNSLTFWTFNINNATSGTFDIPINGIPAGYYDFNVYFRGGDNDFYLGGTIHNLHIVNDIPAVLPNTTSTAPIIPEFPTANPIDYHAQFCDYGTSTTPLFNTLTGAVGGVITSIGQSLADFAGKFSLTDAKNTGQMLADSVLTMREYVASLNAFFGDLPVSQILILYLITFVLVILFRVIKSLVNLIKP
jgi:hypothetical protein